MRILPVRSLSGWLEKNSHYILGEGQANGQLHFGEVMLPWESFRSSDPTWPTYRCPIEEGEDEGSRLV